MYIQFTPLGGSFRGNKSLLFSHHIFDYGLQGIDFIDAKGKTQYTKHIGTTKEDGEGK